MDKPWHLKTEGWSPQDLIGRGERAVQAIWEECKRLTPYMGYDICVFEHGGFVNYSKP